MPLTQVSRMQGKKQQEGHARRPAAEARLTDDRELPVAGRQLTPGNLLALQRAIGNTATTLVIQRALSGVWLDPTPQEGQVIPARGHPLMSEQFSISARIDSTDTSADPISKGQYRQFVKGEFRRNGVAQPDNLDDGPLHPTNWVEDKRGGQRYGYRAKSGGAPSAWFLDSGLAQKDLVNGPYLLTHDTPKATDEDDEMDLQFRGVLIDTRSNAVLNTRNWLVQGPPAVAAVAPRHKKYKWFDPRRWLGAMGVKQFK